MNERNANEEKTKRAKNPKADLELMYIDEYLHGKGYSREELATLPKPEATALMGEASQYASLKLAELESLARLRTKIHDASDPA
ncbi:MAG TPA: hypothetical protein VJ785_01490 [Anaerolineales bacterium]|nr:hypothetical protein [Anaerolineales bacterium]